MLYLYLYFTREQVSGMKKWKILFNIIMETVIFFGIAVLLIIGIPKLMGFFWPFVASWILALLATPLCNFLEKHIKPVSYTHLTLPTKLEV